MNNSVLFIKNGAEGYYEEKKSRFLAKAFPVKSEEEVSEVLDAIRKKYWDARHNCYAFVIGENNEVTRCSDDGEPSGTAGKPMLEVLLGAQVHDCLVVVTRYFGGTLLGTGGLVRAYQKAAKDALDNSTLAVSVDGSVVTVGTDYNGLGKLQYIAQKQDIEVLDTVYGADVQMVFAIPSEKENRFMKDITEATAGKAVITDRKEQKLIMEYCP